ncbi:hypothetical protein [Glycomyces rhizosphaerae]|uniref:Abi-like protein n=1 Tax=Glycomyces rhizosphaerae TaxID=2054422 RepID=A0ABV7Q7F6_9ACTN
MEKSGEDDQLQMNQLRRQLAVHPGKIADDRRSEITRSCDVFFRNMKELHGLVVAAETDQELALELIQNVRPPDVADEFYGRLDQRLQNMISSAVALVEHTKRLLGKYPDTEFAAEFARRNEKIWNLSSSKFLRNLRNYLLHYGMVPFDHTVTISSSVIDSKVLLNCQALLGWDNWTAPVRKFIESSGDSIRLRTVIEEYSKQMQDLYGWMFTEYRRIHAADIAAANEIVARFNLALTGGRTDGRDYGMAPSKEEIRKFRESHAEPDPRGHP